MSAVLENILVIGADVTHPIARSAEGTPPIAAVVGSVGPTGDKILGSMRLQYTDRKEMTEEIEQIVKERIRDWYTAKRKLQTSILYYCDGVGGS
ncbi:hypothetical protein AOQ84DRAFT_378613 [Glonium stellatum]|uniref:Piwi domain-containing protein n=1 Tax=Glonium stellatum TaxID=574774 RepID=A0A8E2JR52_9PEZI|nr:hypothetical protein AOQ84DRAFT_378613 [Glonium stellatum]